MLLLLAQGNTNRQIAQKLNLSPRTIEGHRSSLVSKLGISSRVELMKYVEQHGIEVIIEVYIAGWDAGCGAAYIPTRSYTGRVLITRLEFY